MRQHGSPTPSIPSEDVYCRECGIWFGSQELADLHIRMLHPTSARIQVQSTSHLPKSRQRHNLKWFRKPAGRLMKRVLALFRSAHSATGNSGETVCQNLPAVVISPPPTVSSTTQPGLRTPPRHTTGIYNNLLRVLASITCVLYDRDDVPNVDERRRTCQDSYDQLLHIEGQIRGYETVVYLLAESHTFRIQLLGLSTQIGCRNDPRIWDAVQKDDDHIVILLREALNSNIGQQTALSLREGAAESFLTLITKVLVDGTYTRVLDEPSLSRHSVADSPGDKFRRILHRTSVRLSQKADKLPESIYVRGVKIVDRYNLNGGAFADIYKGVYKGEEVAVKKLRVTLYQSPDQRTKTIKALCREAAIWLHLKHPHVLPFLGIDRTSFGGTACMLSPWMLHGNIHDYIAANGFVEDEILRLLCEVSSGLSYLHKSNIVHGDLRGPNILIDQDRRARLSDFGLANFADSTSASVSDRAAGAIGWSAPELLNPASFGLNNSRATSVSDIYAFGSVCWEVYTGKVPFHDTHMVHALTKILVGQRPPRPSGSREMPQGLWACVKACWRHTPSTRPNAQKISKFMEGFVSDTGLLPTFPPTSDDGAGNSLSLVPWHPTTPAGMEEALELPLTLSAKQLSSSEPSRKKWSW